MDADVIVVGAGPVGLMLAAELRLGGVEPLVLERLTAPSRQQKARGVGPLAAEALHRRGLGDELTRHDAQGRSDLARDHGSDKGHFAWLHKIDPALQEEPDRRYVLIRQPQLERILAGHASQLGVRVLHGHRLTGLAQDGEAVTATVAGPAGEGRLRARWLVGCDGGRSTVRGLTGFDFPGTDPVMTAKSAVVDLVGRERLPPPGRTPAGTLFHGPDSIGVFEFDTEPLHAEREDREVTAQSLEAAVRRVSGADIRITAVRQAVRATDHARQAADYRRGRVLLAGDAAHVHSPNGGQGLSLGLMDAVNLGWKLAAVVRGETDPRHPAPEGLLGTYTAERHPAGAAVLRNTRAQTALMRPGPHVDALREIVSELMDLQEVNRYFGRMMSGLGTRYDLPYASAAGHPLTGRHCPDLRLTVAEASGDAGPARLSDFTRTGRTVLLAPAGDPAPAMTAAAWGHRLDTVTVASTGQESLAAALLRPDGVIAWAAAPGLPADTGRLSVALRTWLGAQETDEGRPLPRGTTIEDTPHERHF